LKFVRGNGSHFIPKRSIARRLIPAALGITALLGGFFVIEGSGAKANTDAIQSTAAARGDAKAASRGSLRTGDVSLAAQQIVDASATTGFVAPSDELDPTTTTTTVPPTTVPPTTLPAPTTTTTAPPPPTTTTTALTQASTGANSQTGKASYYAYKAGGCAHKTLPKGTVVTVTNLSNGKTATCVVNDRGPYVAGRIIDLDTSVFTKLASTGAGVFNARISW